jgi:hypothetical protein
MGKSNPMKRGAFYHLACVKQELKSGTEVAFLVRGRDFAGDEIFVHCLINACRTAPMASVAIAIQSNKS